jgi:hypothetical protein
MSSQCEVEVQNWNIKEPKSQKAQQQSDVMQAEMRTKMQAENADHHHHKYPNRQTNLQNCPNAGQDTHNLGLQVLTLGNDVHQSKPRREKLATSVSIRATWPLHLRAWLKDSCKLQSCQLANWHKHLLQIGLQTSAPFLTGLPDNSYITIAAATTSLEAAIIFGLQVQCA